MLTVNWKGERLNVTRLLLHSDAATAFERSLTPLAHRNGLEVSDETSVPQVGDFWVGCNPVGGWGEADPSQVGWASLVEVPIAVAVLQSPDRIVEDQDFDRDFVTEAATADVSRPHVLQYA